jgi:DNA-binding transcriptional MerR regulator
MARSSYLRASMLHFSELRFCEEKGLIVSTGRRGLRGLFDAGVLKRFVLIARGRAAGFSGAQAQAIT